jgi:hypothetical protein
MARTWLAACLTAAITCPATAQTSQASKLAGLPGTVHVVIAVDSLARAAGVSEDALRKEVEAGLGEGGLSVMSVFGGSYLIVEVHAFQVSTTALLVYDVGLEYHTFAVPARQLAGLLNPLPDKASVPVAQLRPLLQKSVDVALYRRAVYGVGARNQAGAVSSVVRRNLLTFVTDFRSVNPRGQ